MKRNFGKSWRLHNQQCYLFKCHPLWFKQGYLRGNPIVAMRDFPINHFELELYTVNGSYVGPVVIHTPPFLTQMCVLLVWSINRAQEILPEFVLMFCESLKRARPCLASLCALSLVFVVEGVPKLALVCGRRELHWWTFGEQRQVSQSKAREFFISAIYMQTYQLSKAAVHGLCLNKYKLECDCMKDDENHYTWYLTFKFNIYTGTQPKLMNETVCTDPEPKIAFCHHLLTLDIRHYVRDWQSQSPFTYVEFFSIRWRWMAILPNISFCDPQSTEKRK